MSKVSDRVAAPSGLPSSKARPCFERAGIYGKHGVPVMLCGGGAGVIGHDPQQRTNLKIRQTGPCSRSQRQDATHIRFRWSRAALRPDR